MHRYTSIDGYSSHKDSDGLLNFVAESGEQLKKVFVVMGEEKSSLFLVQKLRDNLEVDAMLPKQGETVVLVTKDNVAAWAQK